MRLEINELVQACERSSECAAAIVAAPTEVAEGAAEADRVTVVLTGAGDQEDGLSAVRRVGLGLGKLKEELLMEHLQLRRTSKLTWLQNRGMGLR